MSTDNSVKRHRVLRIVTVLLLGGLSTPLLGSTADEHAKAVFDTCKAVESPGSCFVTRVSALCAQDFRCMTDIGKAMTVLAERCVLEGQTKSDPARDPGTPDHAQAIPSGWTVEGTGITASYPSDPSADPGFAFLQINFAITNPYVPWHTLLIYVRTSGNPILLDGQKLHPDRAPQRLLDQSESDYLRRPRFTREILTAKRIEVPLQKEPLRSAVFQGSEALWSAYLALERKYTQCGFRPIRDAHP